VFDARRPSNLFKGRPAPRPHPEAVARKTGPGRRSRPEGVAWKRLSTAASLLLADTQVHAIVLATVKATPPGGFAGLYRRSARRLTGSVGTRGVLQRRFDGLRRVEHRADLSFFDERLSVPHRPPASHMQHPW
jgi:hypothetical protein